MAAGKCIKASRLNLIIKSSFEEKQRQPSQFTTIIFNNRIIFDKQAYNPGQTMAAYARQRQEETIIVIMTELFGRVTLFFLKISIQMINLHLFCLGFLCICMVHAADPTDF